MVKILSSNGKLRGLTATAHCCTVRNVAVSSLDWRRMTAQKTQSKYKDTNIRLFLLAISL